MSRLSVTIIAKNEERNLPRALASVAGVADEIVVTDTGSTDRTVQIATEFGARVAHFDWIDDFSAAHNFCNRLATGDWLFMLDADEELLPESRAELADCLAREDALAFGVLRQDLTDANHLDRYSEMWQVRLYRRLPEIQFVGRFHHHVSPPLDEIAANVGLAVKESSVRLRHYGYLAELKQEKDRRAVRLLELELADRPGQFYYLVELGLTLLSLGEARAHNVLAEAARMVAEEQPQAVANKGQLAMLLEYVLANPNLPSRFPLTRARARELALAHFPTSIPLLWHLAKEHNERGQFAECARLLEMILALGASHQYDRQVSFSPHLMGDDARLNLGVCCVRLGQLKKAEECFRALGDSPTRGAEARQNLKAIAKLRRK